MIAIRTGCNVELRAGFERVVVAPQGPHTLREVGVIVAVIDGIARRLVAVARSTERDFIRVRTARANALRVHVVRVVVIRVCQPLVVVKVENVVLFRTCVQVPELHEIADIGVRDVGRIIRVLGIVGANAGIAFAERIARLRRAEFKARVGRDVDQHGRVAHRE